MVVPPKKQGVLVHLNHTIHLFMSLNVTLRYGIFQHRK